MPATVARTGVQNYPEGAEYRPPEEVFSADSLASFASTPVTLNHPSVAVTPANAAQYQRGVVTDAAPEARVKVDADPNEWVRTSLVVTHADLLAALESGAAEGISCGYSCDLDPTPGVAPDGTPYKFIQRNIRLNHVAVLTKDTNPRAGASAKVRLDTKEDMKIIKIDGQDYEFGSEKHIEKLDAVHAVALKSATDRADKAEAARDTANEKLKAAEAQLKTDALDARVEARHELLKRAAKFLPAKYETRGKSDHQVRCDALAAAGKDIAGKSEEYVSARFDGMTDADKPATYVDGTKTAARADAAKADSDDAFRAELAKKDQAK